MNMIHNKMRKILFKMNSDEDYTQEFIQDNAGMLTLVDIRKWDVNVTRDRIAKVNKLTREECYDIMCLKHKLIDDCATCPWYNYCTEDIFITVQ